MPAPVTAVGDYVAPIRKQKPQSQIRVAAPARDGDEGVNREGELRETEQPNIPVVRAGCCGNSRTLVIA